MLDKGIICNLRIFSSAKGLDIVNPLSHRSGTYYIAGLLKESKISPVARTFSVAYVYLFIVR
jgi:hypothetical protein